jgi:hypothetical protein
MPWRALRARTLRGVASGPAEALTARHVKPPIWPNRGRSPWRSGPHRTGCSAAQLLNARRLGPRASAVGVLWLVAPGTWQPVVPDRRCYAGLPGRDACWRAELRSFQRSSMCSQPTLRRRSPVLFTCPGIWQIVGPMWPRGAPARPRRTTGEDRDQRPGPGSPYPRQPGRLPRCAAAGHAGTRRGPAGVQRDAHRERRVGPPAPLRALPDALACNARRVRRDPPNLVTRLADRGPPRGLAHVDGAAERRPGAAALDPCGTALLCA